MDQQVAEEDEKGTGSEEEEEEVADVKEIAEDVEDLDNEEEEEGGGCRGLRGWRVSDSAEIVRFHERLSCLEWFYM